jgi:hypothetical protein
MNNWKKILNELSYRVSTGIPDLRNEQHLMKLWDILKEHKWPVDARVELLKRLDEQGKERPCPICESQCQQGQTTAATGCVSKSGGGKQTSGQDKPTQSTKSSAESDNIKSPPEKETASQRKKRREENNRIVDEIIKEAGGDMEVVNKIISERRDQLLQLQDVPAGGGGSLLGEKAGGDAVVDVARDPDITEEQFVDKQMKELKDTPLYNKMVLEAKSKGSPYDKDPERYIKEWLEVSFRTGQNEIKALKEEKKYRYKDPQTEPYPVPVVMDYNQKQSVISTFEQKYKEEAAKCGSGTKESCAKADHYKRQLDYVKELGDTDSGVMYETTDGTVGFKHTSNKKGWDAPHNNTSIDVKGQKIKAIMPTVAKLNNLNDKQTKQLSENISKTIEDASNIVKGAETVVLDDSKKIEDVDEFVSKNSIIAKNANLGNSRSKDQNYLAGAKTSGMVKDKLESMGIDVENATDEEVFKACLELAREGKRDGKTDKVLLKMSELTKRIRNYKKKNPDITNEEIRKKLPQPYANELSDDDLGELVDACMDESMDIFEDTNDTRKETMKVAHRKVVNDLRESDKKLAEENDEEYYPDPETAKNGPHQQAYVDTFLDDIHYTRYIDGNLEGVQSINVDGYDIQPSDFRGCLKDLSDFKGDTETPEGKEALKQHLRETARIKPGDESITFNGKEDGKEVQVGRENYRTKGAAKSILAHLGKDMISCLKKKVGA